MMKPPLLPKHKIEPGNCDVVIGMLIVFDVQYTVGGDDSSI